MTAFLHCSPLQYSWLDNSMDIRAWQATVRRVAKSWTGLKQLSNNSSGYLIFYYLIHFFFFWPHCAAWGISVPWPGIEPGSQQWTWKPGILTVRSLGNNFDTLFLSLYSFMNSPFSISISNYPHLTFCSNCSLYSSLFITIIWEVQSWMGVRKYKGGKTIWSEVNSTGCLQKHDLNDSYIS